LTYTSAICTVAICVTDFKQLRNGRERREEILKYLRSVDHSPTLREIGDAVGLKSASTVQVHLMRLEAAGLVAFSGEFGARRVYAKDAA
jgi:DNA-binding transcriptional ArsR family regulator